MRRVLIRTAVAFFIIHSSVGDSKGRSVDAVDTPGFGLSKIPASGALAVALNSALIVLQIPVLNVE